MRYEVQEVGSQFKVWDNQNGNFITKDVPSREVADEICEDFNKMEKKDFSPLGLPDFSKKE